MGRKNKGTGSQNTFLRATVADESANGCTVKSIAGGGGVMLSLLRIYLIEQLTRGTVKYKNALAVVANYALHKRAFALKKKLEGLLQTILIDSDSGTPCPGADITVDNCGYPGLWNAAFDALIESGRDWLFFIASDVELIEDRLLKLCLDEVLSDKLVSMWTPSVSPDSRASFASCLNCLTPSIRECGAIEGFCFLVRREVLIEVGRIPK